MQMAALLALLDEFNNMKHLFYISCFLLFAKLLFAQNQSSQLKSIEQKLSSGQTGITQILTDSSYMKLHSQTEFRELIKRFAKQEEMTLVTATEPGTRITVK